MKYISIMKKYITQYYKHGVLYISDVVIYSTDWECAEIYAQMYFPNLQIHGEYVSEMKL